jgi:ankyrin repeat protein
MAGCAGPRWSRISPYDRFLLLMSACQNGDRSSVEILLDSGADPNGVKDWSSDPGGRFGDGFSSLLSIAAMGDHVEIMKLLVERGAVIDLLEGEGRTPLAVAVGAKKKEAVAYLLSVGANPTEPFVIRALAECEEDNIRLLVQKAIDAKRST